MMKLGVNIDHVATLRQARGNVSYPDPVYAAQIAKTAGADNITFHLREDRRHIQDKDVLLLHEAMDLPLNMEMAASSKDILSLCLKIKPAYVTLVPEKREEKTTESGLNILKNETTLLEFVEELKKRHIKTSAFLDPNPEDILSAKKIGFDAVELHTGTFCEAFYKERLMGGESSKQYERLYKAANLAHKNDLHVHIGHGITYQNANILAKLPHVEEANIGHVIISEAIFIGLFEAIKKMKYLLNS